MIYTYINNDQSLSLTIFVDCQTSVRKEQQNPLTDNKQVRIIVRY